MNDRLYFLLGDLFSNMLVGAIVASLCAWMVSTEWNMLVAMLVGMPLGMLLALVLGLVLLFRYFGANEVMVPTMLTGMFTGMLVCMIAAMQTLPIGLSALLGALIGAFTLCFCNYSDYLIRGVKVSQNQSEQE